MVAAAALLAAVTTGCSGPHPAVRAPFSLPSGQAAVAVAFSPDGKTLAVGGLRSAYLWNIPRQSLRATVTLPLELNVGAMAFSPDGRTLALVDSSFYDNVYLWDTVSWRRTATLAVPTAVTGMSSVAFSPDGTTLAAGSKAGLTYVWDFSARKRIAILGELGPNIDSVAFSPDGALLATAEDQGVVDLWDTSSWQRIGISRGSVRDPLWPPRQVIHVGSCVSPLVGSPVSSLAFSPDGKTLAIGGSNCNVTYLWDLAGRERLAESLAGPQRGYDTSLAFSPDGKTLAVGYGVVDGSVSAVTELWNVATRSRVATLNYPGSEGINSVAFSPDGNTVASADANGSTYLASLGHTTR